MRSPQAGRRPRVRNDKDVLDELRDVKPEHYRPGAADSDINVFAQPVTVPYSLIDRCRREIERLRQRAF